MPSLQLRSLRAKRRRLPGLQRGYDQRRGLVAFSLKWCGWQLQKFDAPSPSPTGRNVHPSSELRRRRILGYIGGGERTRTADFYIANVALYQLSYTPGCVGETSRHREGSVSDGRVPTGSLDQLGDPPIRGYRPASKSMSGRCWWCWWSWTWTCWSKSWSTWPARSLTSWSIPAPASWPPGPWWLWW